MKIYLTHRYGKKSKIFQREYEVEKLHREGNDVVVYLKSKDVITIYPAFLLSGCGKNVESAYYDGSVSLTLFYKLNKEQKKKWKNFLRQKE